VHPLDKNLPIQPNLLWLVKTGAMALESGTPTRPREWSPVRRNSVSAGHSIRPGPLKMTSISEALPSKCCFLIRTLLFGSRCMGSNRGTLRFCPL
jgi:hypothetical protein